MPFETRDWGPRLILVHTTREWGPRVTKTTSGRHRRRWFMLLRLLDEEHAGTGIIK